MAKRFFTIASGSFVIVEETPSEHGGGQTHVHIELLHNLLSGISCSFVDTIGHISSVERFSEIFYEKAETCLIFFLGMH
jgi:hypothetical protein